MATIEDLDVKGDYGSEYDGAGASVGAHEEGESCQGNVKGERWAGVRRSALESRKRIAPEVPMVPSRIVGLIALFSLSATAVDAHAMSCAEVERLLADGRSWRFVEQFCGQWLDVDAVDRVAVNPEYYPDFDNQLKVSMRGETLHFFREVMRNDLSALSFLDADFTMLDEPLEKYRFVQKNSNGSRA